MALIIPESPERAQDPADGRMHSPAAARNLGPIVELLEKTAPRKGDALEIASGTGEHVIEFARRFPDLIWHPTDISDERLRSISAWNRWSGCQNIAAPMFLDVTRAEATTNTHRFALVFCANLFHLITWGQTKQSLSNMFRLCASGGSVLIYGPFRRGISYASEGDRAFDEALREQDNTIGLKDVEGIVDFAQQVLGAQVRVDHMAASNLTLTLSRD